MSNKKPSYQDLEKQIIELKEELKLKESKDRFNVLLKASDDMITIHKPSGEYIYYNGPTCYAITAQDVVGKMPSDLFDKDVSTTLFNTFKRVKQTGNSETIEVLLDWLGEKRWFSEYIYPLKNANGEVIELVKVCRDIHKRKIAEQVIEKQKKEKERQVEELKISRKKIKASLERLEKEESALQQVSIMAKIGYWEYDNDVISIVWSDYLFDLFGLNPKDGVPPRDVLFAFFDKNSQKKIDQANSDLISKGIPYDIEIRLINKKKKEVWVRNIVQPVYNKQNEIIGRRGLLQNITDSKNTRKELEFSKQKIETTFEQLEKRKYSMYEASKVAKIGYWEHDTITDAIVWSDYIHTIFGSDPKDGVPSQEEIYITLNKESQEKLEHVTLELISKGISYDIELQLINLNKEEVWVRNSAQPVYNKQNEIVGKRGVMQDISESKKAQRELELSKEKIQTTLELVKENEYSLKEAGRMAKIGYWRFDILTDTLFWSEILYHIYGVDPKFGVPKVETILTVFSKESRKLLLESLMVLTNNGIPYDIELELTNFKNEKRWVRNIGEPIYNDDNEVVGRRGVTKDITQSKLNQKNLDQKNEKLLELNNALNQAQKLSNVGSWQWNMETDTAEWSDEMYNIYGVSKNNFYPSNENVQKFTLLEDAHKIEKGINSLLVGKVFVPFEFRIKRPSGEIRHLFIQALEKKPQENVFGVTKDITEQKQIKEENLIIQDNYKRLFNNATVSIWNEDFSLVFKEVDELRKLNISNITLYLEENPEILIRIINKVKVNKVNKATLKLFKAKSSKEFLKNIQNTFGKDADKVFRKLIESIWNNEKSFTSEVNYKTLKGDEFAAIISIPFPQTEIEQKTVPVSIQSIQNIKDAEKVKLTTIKELERSEFLFNESGKLANIGAWELELPSQKIRWSNQVFKIHGIPVGEVPPLEECLTFYTDGGAEILTKAIEEAIEEKKKYDLVLRFKNRQNEKLWINSIGYPLTNKEGEVTSLIGVFQDITQQKIRQNRLDVQNEKLFKLNNALKESQEISKLGSWEYLFKTDTVTWSEELFHIFERKQELGAPNYTEHKLLYTEESFALLNESVENCIKHQIPYKIESDIYTTNGSLKHLVARGKVLKDNNNNIIGCYGTAQDITEEKQIRLKIAKADEMYRILTDNSNDLICLQEPDSTFKYISPSVKNILGYEQSEYLGRQVFNLVHKEDIQRLKGAMDKKVFQGTKIDAFSFRVRHKEGHFVWLEFLSSPVYKENKISYYVTSARDITQWVLAKQEIEEYQTSLQKLTTEMTLIEEKQKKEIASNIHDHLSQSLVISKMKINELKKDPQLKVIDGDLKFIEKHISEALENSRKITYELSPPVLYQLGIIEALNWLFENVEVTHKIKCRVQSNVSNIKLSEVKSILLYRSIQEVINNAIKYANASLITLNLDKNKHGLDIFLTDNGVGFDTSILNNYNQNHSGSGFGLFTVKERIRNIKGEFKITSKINTGTSVNIFIPLSI